MRILLDNVNLDSSSGPNHFGSKLKRYLEKEGNECGTDVQNPDVQLSFIETRKQSVQEPLVLRMDGIYFDIETDFVQKNKNILRSYEMSGGVIFQSEYCKELIFKFFGEHDNHEVIHNGADLKQISETPKLENDIFNKHEDVWTCASSWYYNNNPATPRRWKRLKENVEFFMNYSKPTDCLIVAGDVHERDRVGDNRVYYVGRLERDVLFSLYKASKYFIHLASPDACPNVVVDARASGCKLVCSSLGGAKEIAGPDALIIEEDHWDYNPMDLNGERKMDLTRIITKCYNAEMDMEKVTRKYESFLEKVL